MFKKLAAVTLAVAFAAITFTSDAEARNFNYGNVLNSGARYTQVNPFNRMGNVGNGRSCKQRANRYRKGYQHYNQFQNKAYGKLKSRYLSDGSLSRGEFNRLRKARNWKNNQNRPPFKPYW